MAKLLLKRNRLYYDSCYQCQDKAVNIKKKNDTVRNATVALYVNIKKKNVIVGIVMVVRFANMIE